MAKEKKVKLITPPFVMGFPNLFEMTTYKTTSGEESKPSYNMVAIFEPKAYKGKEKERWDALVAEMDAQCLKQFGKKWADCKKVVDQEEGTLGVPGFKAGLYNGNSEKKRDKPGYGEGKFYCTIKSYNPVGVVQYNGVGKKSTDVSVTEGNTDIIYAGITARAKITVWAYEAGGVSFWLDSVQKLKDGPRLDNRGNAADDFEDDVDGSWADQDEPAAGEADPFA